MFTMAMGLSKPRFSEGRVESTACAAMASEVLHCNRKQDRVRGAAMAGALDLLMSAFDPKQTSAAQFIPPIELSRRAAQGLRNVAPVQSLFP